VGIDLKTSTIDLDADGRPVPLQIWDTAGQEMFRSIIASYYRGANGVLLMFDVTRRSSYDALDGWLREVREKAPEKAPVVLAANKCDLPNRVVSSDEASAWAAERGLVYIETSAATDVRINDVFITLVALAVGRGAEAETLLTRAKITQGGRAPADKADVVQINGLAGGNPRHSNASSGGCAC
jgi:small GTP-binding protein